MVLIEFHFSAFEGDPGKQRGLFCGGGDLVVVERCYEGSNGGAGRRALTGEGSSVAGLGARHDRQKLSDWIGSSEEVVEAGFVAVRAWTVVSVILDVGKFGGDVEGAIGMNVIMGASAVVGLRELAGVVRAVSVVFGGGVARTWECKEGSPEGSAREESCD